MLKILTLGLSLILPCLMTPTVQQENRHRRHTQQQETPVRKPLAASPAGVTEILCHPRPLFLTPDTVSLLFMGDIMMHQGQIADAKVDEDRYDFSGCFDRIGHLIKGADKAVANMEFTLSGKPYTGYPCFSAPDNYADTVAGSGVDIFLTANNHILDKGERGIERTLARYSEMEREGRVQHTGCALTAADDSLRFPLFTVVRGFRFALLNFTYGTNSSIGDEYPKVHRCDTAAIGAAIDRAKEAGADFIIALPHWGVEYVLRHSASQERLARWLASRGCDAVIGAHPHVVQDTQVVKVPRSDGIGVRSVPVVYSMGNLISNMSARNTQVGMMVTLRFARDRSGGKSLLEPELTLTWCSRPGRLADGYTTIAINEYAGSRSLWRDPGDYDKMTSSYERIKEETGIQD